jgi:hypothetical protein
MAKAIATGTGLADARTLLAAMSPLYATRDGMDFVVCF